MAKNFYVFDFYIVKRLRDALVYLLANVANKFEIARKFVFNFFFLKIWIVKMMNDSCIGI